MFDRIKALLTRWHDIKEVEALTDRDLDDLGMSRDQVLAFVQMPQDVADRVTAMGRIFGIPEAALKRDHAQWVDLLSVCGHCSDRGACGLVLDKGDLSGPPMPASAPTARPLRPWPPAPPDALCTSCTPRRPPLARSGRSPTTSLLSPALPPCAFPRAPP